MKKHASGTKSKPALTPVEGVLLDLPSGFAVAETSVTLRPVQLQGLSDPRRVQAQPPIQANLIARSRTVDPALTLEDASIQLTAELVNTMPGMAELQTVDFKFKDDARGYLVSFEIEVAPNLRVRQHHALRVDPGRVTHVTLTTGLDTNPAVLDVYLQSIASAGCPGRTQAGAVS